MEAKSNVNKRLDFIKGELSRLDTRLSDYQSKASKRQQQVTQILLSHALHASFHLSGKHISLVCSWAHALRDIKQRLQKPQQQVT